MKGEIISTIIKGKAGRQLASIYEQKRENHKHYYLREWVNGKVKLTYLGTKPPIAKSRGWTKLSSETIDRLKRKAKQRATEPSPNPSLPEGKYAHTRQRPARKMQSSYEKARVFTIELKLELR